MNIKLPQQRPSRSGPKHPQPQARQASAAATTYKQARKTGLAGERNIQPTMLELVDNARRTHPHRLLERRASVLLGE
jgi:hypothetical protein